MNSDTEVKAATFQCNYRPEARAGYGSRGGRAMLWVYAGSSSTEMMLDDIFKALVLNR